MNMNINGGFGVAGHNLRPRFRAPWAPSSVLSGRLYAAHRSIAGHWPAVSA